MTEENLTPEERGMKKFQVMVRPAKGGGIEKAIFIDGQMLDWQVDLMSYAESMKMGPEYVVEVQKSIAKHFIEAVSDTLGRKVTIDDIKKATETGWI